MFSILFFLMILEIMHDIRDKQLIIISIFYYHRDRNHKLFYE